MNETFAQNLKSLRKQHNLSQQELADHLNVHIGSITKWEKNGVKPRAQKIEEIAAFFNITPDELRGAKIGSDGTRKRLSRTELKKHKTIGQKIKALREHYDMNFTDLGKAIGATSYTVSKWEREVSKPYTDVIQRLADYFGVDFEELAGEPRKSNPIGDRIRALRAENQMSRDELSEKLGMSSQSIHSWEQGNSVPRSRALNKLAEIFNVGLEDILGQNQVQASVIEESNDYLEDDLNPEIMELVETEVEDNAVEVEPIQEVAAEVPTLVIEVAVPEQQSEEAAVQIPVFEPKIVEFTPTSRPEGSNGFVPVAISRENEIIDLEVLFSSANKRLVIGDSLLTQDEKERALNVLAAIFQK